MSILVSIFFCLGALDFFLENRLGLGQPFKEGLESIVELLLIMTGVMVLAPWLGSVLAPAVGPFFQSIGCDPSLIAGMMLSCDGGAAILADTMALSKDAALFNGMIVGAFLGITFVFTLPLALSHSKGARQSAVVNGLLIGILVLPAGCLITGLLAGIPLSVILSNVWPVFLFSVLLLILFLCFRPYMVPVFRVFSCLVRGIALFGFGLEVLSEMTGITFLPNLTPLEEIYPVICEIGVFLAGILPCMAFLRRILQKPLAAGASLLGISPESITAMILALANPIPVFLTFDELDCKGYLTAYAFLTPAAFAVGDHLAFAMQFAPSIAIPLMIGKILAGCLALILGLLLSPVLLPKSDANETLAAPEK